MNVDPKTAQDFVEEITNLLLKNIDNMESAYVAMIAMQCLTTIIFSQSKSPVDAIIILETILLECIKRELDSQEKHESGRN